MGNSIELLKIYGLYVEIMNLEPWEFSFKIGLVKQKFTYPEGHIEVVRMTSITKEVYGENTNNV